MELGKPQIIDLRASGSLNDSLHLRLRKEIIEGLAEKELLVPGKTPEDIFYAYRKIIPTVALYDNLGLELYDQITAIDDYYPFATELAILQAKGCDIACRLSGLLTSSNLNRDPVFRPTSPHEQVICARSNYSPPETAEDEAGFPFALVELGAGSLKKTSHLLKNVAELLQMTAGAPDNKFLSQAEYYALDLEPEQLHSTLLAIKGQENSGLGPRVGKEVQTYGVCGTYNQGLEWINKSLNTGDRMQNNRCRKAILWLGSSIGNFSPSEAIDFLRNELGRVLDTETRVLIGIDNCQVPEKVQRAYSDSEGLTRKFILNIITVVARQLGLQEDMLNPNQFEYVSRYNIEMGRHEAYLRARQELNLRIPFIQGVDMEDNSIRIQAGELILVERSYKFSPDEVYRLFDQSGLRVIQKWTDVSSSSSSVCGNSWTPTHTLYLVERAPFHFVRTAAWPVETQYNCPTLPKFPAFHKSVEATSKQQWLLQILDTLTKYFKSLGIFGDDQAQSPKKQFSVSAKNDVSEPKPMTVLIEEKTSKQNAVGIPSLADWKTLWKAWDIVTLEMIPKNKLHHKPIALRHAFFFYLGHIPVFADIHISRYFNEPNTEPRRFAEIFERGIDPNIDDAAQCHSHSPFPDQEEEWPALEELFDFQGKLRERINNLYASLNSEVESRIRLTRRLGRVLCMIHEHEAMHLETLLYMIQQMQDMNYPPGFTIPDWGSLTREWNLIEAAQGGKSELMEFPDARKVIVGHDDFEDEDHCTAFSHTHEYGWDNESPSRNVIVQPFKLEQAPVTNEEYLEFLLQSHSDTEPIAADTIPASWVYGFIADPPRSGRHQIKIKTVYGHVNFHFAKHWPLQASGSQLACFAKSKGGRLPTADELRLYFSDNPIHHSAENSIGFLNWHPLPPQRPQKGSDGRWRGGWNGGVWEWTSTEFKSHSNFKPSELYPGYSNDFFDHKHYILLGGSWATIPRIAHRKSFVNWYQFKYPYVFAGGRVAYDY